MATNSVWFEISSYLNGRMSGNAIHTFVYRGAHGVKEKLGFKSRQNVVESDVVENIHYQNNSNLYLYLNLQIIINLFKANIVILGDQTDFSSDCSEILPSKEFVITFSPEEWITIQPEEVCYKSNSKNQSSKSSRMYHVLPKNSWTPIIAEHFWEHTHLPCCLSFRKAKVHSCGNFYIKIVGKCSLCESNFEGIIYNKPPAEATR